MINDNINCSAAEERDGIINSRPCVTVLVPCFNVEKFVGKCIESLKRQTLNNIEIICLNDGSTDKTLSIIRAIVGSDSRFKVIDKTNSGYGATMNLGLSLAKGEYIGIVESDDYIEDNMFECLYKKAKCHNLDISRCCFFKEIDGESIIDKCKFIPKNIVFKPTQKLNSFRHPPSIWAAIYKRSFIERFCIRFLETPGASFQDISFSFKVNLCSERVMCIEDPLLHYRIHQNNSVKSNNKPYVVFDEYDECLRFAEKYRFELSDKSILMKLEYATFKWNYLRLSDNCAHEFFKKWTKRWVERKGYGLILALGQVKIYLYYVAVTRFPLFFEMYLKGKQK